MTSPGPQSPPVAPPLPALTGLLAALGRNRPGHLASCQCADCQQLRAAWGELERVQHLLRVVRDWTRQEESHEAL